MRALGVSRVLLVACVLSTAGLVEAQQAVPTPLPPPAQSAPTAPPRTLIPVKIDVVLMRFKGTEKIASMPYSLWAVDGNRAMLRLGSSVPVPQTTLVSTEGMKPVTSYQYHEVGVSIDVNVTPQSDGRYRLSLLVEETSLGDGAAAEGLATKLPVIRRYRLDTQVIVRDGQPTEFNVATDRVTGETIRAQVTMTVLK
jgi:Flp pilus assembly secretin CpaC